jgi:hypothetical protein
MGRKHELVIHNAPYIILYRITEDRIEILHAFHMGMDWLNSLQQPNSRHWDHSFGADEIIPTLNRHRIADSGSDIRQLLADRSLSALATNRQILLGSILASLIMRVLLP